MTAHKLAVEYMKKSHNKIRGTGIFPKKRRLL